MRLTTFTIHLTSLAVSILLLGGCESPGFGPGGTIGGPRVLTLNDFATRLNLRVVDVGHSSATLRNPSNMVMLFGTPATGAYVNGREVASDGVVGNGGRLAVTESLAATIHSSLRPSRPRVSDYPTRRTKRPRPKPKPKLSGTVVLDAGHGGRDPGALGCVKVDGAKLCEKDVTLAVTLQVARLLTAKGVEVVLTRARDVYVDLDKRVEVRNTNDADLFVSIHADACGTPSVKGYHILIPRTPDSRDRRAAKAIISGLSSSGATSRGIRKDTRGLRVLRKATVPAVLVEMGFLTNPGEARQLGANAHRRRLAQGIAEGILDYLQ